MNEKIIKVIDKLKELSYVVEHLRYIYDENKSLNDLQPISMERIIPMSLDEWQSEINSCIEDWRKKLDEVT